MCAPIVMACQYNFSISGPTDDLNFGSLCPNPFEKVLTQKDVFIWNNYSHEPLTLRL